jgi:hypothetical protein
MPGITAVAVALLVVGPALSGPATHVEVSDIAATSRANLARLLDEANVRLDALEARRDAELARQHRLDAARTEEIRALVHEVLTDADERASLLSAGATAGYDDAFFITNSDGTFLLEMNGQVQLRWVLNRQNNARDDDTRWGFENRRTKLKFSGHVLTPRLEYSMTAAFNRESGTARREGMWLAYQVTDELAIRAGRFRSPLLREEAVSSKRQLLVERSLIQRTFRQRRTTGLGLRWQSDSFRAFAAVMDTSEGLFDEENWLLSTRVETLVEGSWKSLKDFSSFPDDEPVVAFGAGALYEERNRGAGDPDSTLVRWTADASVELGGATFLAAIVGNHFDEDGAPSRDQYGVVIHGGYFFGDDWEIFGRYEWGEADGQVENLSVATVGLNRYFDGHRLKWTADCGYGFKSVRPFWASSGAAWRRDRPGEDGQLVLRAQLQLLF